ncbi:MAG: HAMP domain-containing histidine kinase [Oscillibacter sp.]|jgi:signal transduction histidine kinase|nr:HAMP domain-containing histidine kinase [Oscillibacter sp.]
MIVQLRKKFILITMGSVIVVLAVLMGIVNAANYRKMDRNAGEILTVLAENSGVFPDSDKRPSESDGALPAEPSEGGKGAAAPGGPRSFSPETPYETRYFSVTLNDSGATASVNTGRIAAVSTKEAVSMAQKLRAGGRNAGYLGNYKYRTVKTDQGTQYLFLDCTRDLSSVRDFLSNSLLVSLCGIAAVFVLVMVLSKRAIRPVAESYEKQKKFITNAGHELRTPLTVIDSCTEVLEMEQGGNKWTEGIRSQVRRLTELTQNLVSLARMDEGGDSFPMAEFSLSDAVNETLEPFRLLAENRGLRLCADIQEGIRLWGSEQLLRQLCSILADNAVKYALPDSEIRFSLCRRGKKAVLTCVNRTQGLQRGDQDVLFDRFYRGDASRSSEKGGSGIGLSMARSIAAAHHGKISARSDDGESLTVTLQL